MYNMIAYEDLWQKHVQSIIKVHKCLEDTPTELVRLSLTQLG